ncbi:hypothetical protein IWQ56_000769 [Coemansia nantahalensis]|nr:hypothetical protein IWQ56_000769 [Coemansia nantahalensis]
MFAAMATPTEPHAPALLASHDMGSATPQSAHFPASPFSFSSSSTVSSDIDAMDALFGGQYQQRPPPLQPAGSGAATTPPMSIMFDDVHAGALQPRAGSGLHSPMFGGSTPQLSTFDSPTLGPAGGAGYPPAAAHEPRVLRRNLRLASHPYHPQLAHMARPGGLARRSSGGLPSAFTASRPQKSSTCIIPAINQDGSYKCCANCLTATTPSWRRHPDTQELLCNACGLYLRLHRRSRPITLDEAGQVQVIRKNAAVQREPINLPPAAMSPSAPRLPAVPPAGALGFLPMRSTTTLAALQGVAVPFPLVGMAASPAPSGAHAAVPFMPPAADVPDSRLIGDIMQLNMFGMAYPAPAPLDSSMSIDELGTPKSEA